MELLNNLALGFGVAFTLQNLLYNGIIHNFPDDEPESLRILNAVADLEDTLIDERRLASDFQLLIGRRR